MKNKDLTANGSQSNSSGETPCYKCNRANCCADCRCGKGFRLEQEKLEEFFRMLEAALKSQRRVERSMAAIVNLYNRENPAGNIILDNRVVSVMKSTMISAAVERLNKGNEKTSRVLREVFENFRDFPGAYESFESFKRQVFRYYGKQ